MYTKGHLRKAKTDTNSMPAQIMHKFPTVFPNGLCVCVFRHLLLTCFRAHDQFVDP